MWNSLYLSPGNPIETPSHFSLLSDFKPESLWITNEVPRPLLSCRPPLVIVEKRKGCPSLFLSIREQLWCEQKGKVDVKDPAGESFLLPYILNQGFRLDLVHRENEAF